MSGEGRPSNDSLEIKKGGFQWVVKKEVFSGDKIHSSKNFNFGFEAQTNWYLSLKICTPSDGGTFVQLYLMPGSKPAGQIPTKFKIGLITKDGKEKNVKYANYAFTDIKGLGFPYFIKMDSLLAEENNFFELDKLTIFCDLQVSPLTVEVPESPLVREQSQRLQSGEFSDFTLVVEDEELKVHRCMLSSSPVFRAMFQHEMKEKQSCRVEIEGLTLVGVKGLLEFLYTGRVKELEKIANEVLPAADMYGVEGLKALCEKELCYELRPATVADFLSFSELHSATKLKEQAITFICENPMEVVKEESFRQLNGSNLFEEVVCALADKLQSGKPLANRIKLN